MVSTCKMFRISEDTDFGSITQKLKEFREVEPYEGRDREGELITEVTDLEVEDGTLKGLYTKDTLVSIYHRDGEIQVPKTKETRLVFQESRGEIFLVIFTEKPKANKIANELSEAIF
ncbi:MAG: hypothetical protein ABEJ72_03420, partial [Candidatus Aenigmatarchaeota archaeon]